MIEIRAPEFGESITEATVAEWLKRPGDAIEMDEPLVALETDKVTMEIPAPMSGVLSEIVAHDGETVEVGGLLARMEEGASAKAPAPASKPAPAPKAAPAPAPASDAAPPIAPSARVIAETKGLDASSIAGTGPRGGVTKADALRAAQSSSAAPTATAPPLPQMKGAAKGEEERVRMTRIRQTIARRLKEAQTTAAMLTTFNDVDMSKLMALRQQLREPFEKKYGVRPGFMGFFVKACCAALEEVPEINARIEGNEIIYRRYANIGVAVGTDRGLVVPVLRQAQSMSLAEIEKSIAAYAIAARDGKLPIEALSGGTFTISNGGVYGSLLSTPILNAPQSGVLGMHRIEERPIALEGEVVIRPMMYLALTYDHRLVDGREAVTFLARVKERIENPARILLGSDEG